MYKLLVTISISVFIVVVIVQGACSQDSVDARSKVTLASNKTELREILDQLASRISQESRVQPRLPAVIPDVEEELPLYASTPSLTRNSYSVELIYQANCKGAYACTFARFQGSTAPISVERGDRDSVVNLHRGIRGHFISYRCGANCGEPILEWTEHSDYYVVAMKAGDKETLIRIANSAIDNGGH